jgi:hypothetical protein
LRFHF